jgi:hypothetical protein
VCLCIYLTNFIFVLIFIITLGWVGIQFIYLFFFKKWIPNSDPTWLEFEILLPILNQGLARAYQVAWLGLVTLGRVGIGRVLPNPREQCKVHWKRHL